MTHQRSVPVTGDAARAFDLAAVVLTSNGFRLERRDDRSLLATGRGLASTKQNPLLGASRVELSRVGGELRLEAELGGLRTLVRFLVAFPAGLAVAVLIAWLAADRQGGPIPWQVALALVPWAVLSPLMIRMTRRRTARALDDLLASLATEAGRR